MSEAGVLDDFEHRTRWLGRVRAGVQRILLCRASLGADGVTPGRSPGFGEEVAHLLTGLPSSGPEALAAVDAEIEAYDADLREALEATRAVSGDAPGDTLRRALDLSFEDECLLWAIAAPDLDPGVSRLYRVVGEVHRGACVLDFALQVAFGSAHRALESGVRRVSGRATLARLGLVVAEHGGPNNRGLALGLAVRATRPVLDRLLDDAHVYVPDYPVTVSTERPELILPASFEQELNAAMSRAARQGPLRVWLIGPVGTGKRTIGARLAHDLSRPHWTIDVPALLADSNCESRLVELVREARCAGALLHFHSAGAALAADRHQRSVRFIRLLTGLLVDHRLEVLFDSVELPTLPVGLGDTLLRVPRPGPDERERMWRKALPAQVAEELPRNMARRYFLTGGQIAAAASRALSLVGHQGNAVPTPSDVESAARSQLSDDVGSLAERVAASQTWDDVVLPDEVVQQYGQVLSFAKNRRKIFDEWGFYRKLSYGRGLSVLLAGPPGTGKTMLAGILARDLGIDLYRIDLSQVQSKFIGETEKHLSQLFDYAGETGAGLLFDEADSLFAKRTDVSSSVDRYANLNVNYLLQRIESFTGVAVLTTNLKQALDPALLRRIRFSIEVPSPDARERHRLWQSMIPPETPCTLDEYDFEALANDFELAGGHIKNAVIRGAIEAAEQGSSLTYEHLRDAATWTCRELGMLVRTP